MVYCNIHGSINDKDFIVSKNQVRYELEEWRRLLQNSGNRIEADYQVESIDFKHEWSKNYPLSTFIKSISTVHIMNEDGKITTEPINVKIKEVMIIVNDKSVFVDDNIKVRLCIEVSGKSGEIISERFRGQFRPKEWNDMVKSIDLKDGNISIEIESYEEVEALGYPGNSTQLKDYLRRVCKFDKSTFVLTSNDINEPKSQSGSMMPSARISRNSRLRNNEPSNPFAPNAGQISKRGKVRKSERGSSNREERLAELRAKSAATRQFAKEAQESKSGSTKRTRKSSIPNRQGSKSTTPSVGSKGYHNTRNDSSKYKPRGGHNSEKNKKRRKKNSSPLGDAINAKNRAERDVKNAKKNLPRKAITEAQKKLDFWTKRVNQLKKSNK